MTYEPRLITPFDDKSGLSRYYKPWLIGDEAFETATNMMFWRGLARKRNGYSFLARFPAQASIQSISNANPAVLTTTANHNLTNGQVLHIWIEGVTDADYTDLNNRLFRATITGATTMTLADLYGTAIDKSTAGAPAGMAGSIYQPVQGLKNRIIPNSLDEELLAFDQTRAWRITGALATDISFFQTTGAALTWTGGNNDYYWATNYAQAFWVSNFVDPVRFYNGSTTQGWNNQRFTVDSAPNLVHRALIVIPFKGRIVLLNTYEGLIGAAPGTNFAQRARWSQIGTPYVPATGADPAVVLPTLYSGATDANAWRDDIPGRGGYVDAPTTERIVGAEIVNDNLIVFFQRSTKRLRYTGNQILPFVWEDINTHYGAESTHATLGFDQLAFAFSRVGFVGADTNNVRRIDENIPDQAFEVETGDNMEELSRVQAARDFYRNYFYWSYPDAATNARTPNRILAYNYDNKTWSIYEISIRCFARYKDTDDRIWSNYTVANDDEWENQGDATWSLGQDNFFELVGGRDDGRIHVLFSPDGPSADNGTSINFDLRTKRFNPYIGQGKECRLQFFDVYTTGTADGQITIDHYIDADDDTPVESLTIDLANTENAKYTRVFLGTVAEFHQLKLYLSDVQYADSEIANSPFELQGIVIHTKPETRIKSGRLL